MLKQFLMEQIETIQADIEVLEGFLPAILGSGADEKITEKEMKALKKDIFMYSVKRDYYHVLLDNNYNYNKKEDDYIQDYVTELTKMIDAASDEYHYIQKDKSLTSSAKIKMSNAFKDYICRLSYKRDLYLNFNIGA